MNEPEWALHAISVVAGVMKGYENNTLTAEDAVAIIKLNVAKRDTLAELRIKAVAGDTDAIATIESYHIAMDAIVEKHGHE